MHFTTLPCSTSSGYLVSPESPIARLRFASDQAIRRTDHPRLARSTLSHTSFDVTPMDNEHRRISEKDRESSKRGSRLHCWIAAAGLKHTLCECYINFRDLRARRKINGTVVNLDCIDKIVSHACPTCARADADVNLRVQWSMLRE